MVSNILDMWAIAKEKMFAGHIVTPIYVFYLRIINDGTLPSIVSISGSQNLLDINLKKAELIVQYGK
jgi:hypothetical protein